mgnify:CR=1 FL=1
MRSNISSNRASPRRTSREAQNRAAAAAAEPADEHETPHASRRLEVGLMVFSVLIALAGIGLAYRFYVTSPEIVRAARRALGRRSPVCC